MVYGGIHGGSNLVNEQQFQFLIEKSDEIIIVTITGEITTHNVDSLQELITNSLIKTEFRYLLVDIRSLKGRMGVTDTYYRARTFPVDTTVEKIAVVDLAENENYQSFQETVSVNMGFNWRWFDNVDDAKAWLNHTNI